MFWEQRVEYAVRSDLGMRRQNNEDAYLVQIATNREQWKKHGHLFLVADGMGGHAVGELASKLAADTVPHTYFKSLETDPGKALWAALQDANRAIFERGELNADFARMGTTCTTLVLAPQGAYVGHVGDSRCYRVRGPAIEQLSFDHSLQWELLKEGKMSAEEIMQNEPRNIITKCLGPEKEAAPDIEGPFPIEANDVFVLCSDGLTGLLRDEEIGQIVRTLPPTEACQFLVDLTNLRGGIDNVTVVIVRVGRAPDEQLIETDDDEEESGEDWQSWTWFGGIAASGLLTAAGVALGALGNSLGAGLCLGGAVLVALVLVWSWWYTRRQQKQQVVSQRPSSGSPYRTASAKVSATFLQNIANLEGNLQRAADEERWTIDWPQHLLYYHSAKTNLQMQKYRDALSDYAQAIHYLTVGLYQSRRARVAAKEH